LTSTPQPDTTAHPAPADLTGQELEETIKLAHEWGALKQLPRTGRTRAGIQQPESVAAHTARTAMLAWVIAGLEGADQDRAAALALFHDSQESRTGDLDHVGRNYLQPVGNEQITSDQAAALPQPLAAALHRLVGEYEGRASREAECGTNRARGTSPKAASTRRSPIPSACRTRIRSSGDRGRPRVNGAGTAVSLPLSRRTGTTSTR
jgi:hypothetical protein